MAGEENLIPMSRRTKEEQREIAIKGGKASGKARRKKKALREQAEFLLSLPLQDTIKNERTGLTLLDEIAAITGVENMGKIDNQMALLAVRFMDAINKNSSTSVQSYNCLIDAVGERKNSIDINGGLTVNFGGEDKIAD